MGNRAVGDLLPRPGEFVAPVAIYTPYLSLAILRIGFFLLRRVALALPMAWWRVSRKSANPPVFVQPGLGQQVRHFSLKQKMKDWSQFRPKESFQLPKNEGGKCCGRGNPAFPSVPFQAPDLVPRTGMPGGSGGGGKGPEGPSGPKKDGDKETAFTLTVNLPLVALAGLVGAAALLFHYFFGDRAQEISFQQFKRELLAKGAWVRPLAWRPLPPLGSPLHPSKRAPPPLSRSGSPHRGP